jgi:hypothetical protein
VGPPLLLPPPSKVTVTPPSPLVLHTADDVPEIETVVPFSLQVMLQLELLPPTEQVTPLTDSVPQRQIDSPCSTAVQHAGADEEPEQATGTVTKRAVKKKRVSKVRMSLTVRLRSVFGKYDGKDPQREEPPTPSSPPQWQGCAGWPSPGASRASRS